MGKVETNGLLITLTSPTTFPSWLWENRAAGLENGLRFDVGLGESGSSKGWDRYGGTGLRIPLSRRRRLAFFFEFFPVDVIVGVDLGEGEVP